MVQEFLREKVMAKKDPLSCVDTERAIIGVVVASRGNALDNVRLPEEAFTTVQTRECWKGCVRLYSRGVQIDPAALIAEMGDQYARIGKSQFEEIIAWQPAENTHLYENILKEKLMLRRLRDTADHIKEAVVVPGVSATDVLGTASSELGMVDADGDANNLAPVLLDKISAELLDMQQGNVPPVIKTHIEWFDRNIGGLYPGEYIAIASRPGLGKTALMEAIIENLVANEYNQRPVLVFERDMNPKTFMIRLACRAARIPYTFYHRRSLSEPQIAYLMKIVDKYKTAPLILKSPAGMTPETMIAEIRREVRVNKVEAVFLDHIQALNTGKDDLRTGLTKASLQLRACVTDYNVSLTALAHINRSGAEKPTANDIKEFDQLLGDVDALMMLWRDKDKEPEEDRTDSRAPKAMVASVGKCRSGGTPDITLWWDGPTMSFTERVEAKEE